jgi:hypothetical protein
MRGDRPQREHVAADPAHIGVELGRKLARLGGDARERARQERLLDIVVAEQPDRRGGRNDQCGHRQHEAHRKGSLAARCRAPCRADPQAHISK